MTTPKQRPAKRKYFNLFKKIIINFNDENIFSASEFKLSNREKRISYTDALGYAIALNKMSKLKEIREQVKKELECIPKGNFHQNELRMFYWPLRMNSLGKKSQNNDTKEEILKKSIESVRKDFPDFVPQFDENFFKLKVKK